MYGALIVDDEAPVREAIRALGYWDELEIAPVREASDGQEALRILDGDESIRIVITDMKMPVYDGSWLLAELAKRPRTYATIIISGYTDFRYTRQAIRAQAIDYILKPIDQDDLAGALSSAVAALEGPALPAAGPDGCPDRVIEEVKAFAAAHCAEPLTLEEIASRFAMSREHLSRRFKKSAGTNLFEYIALRRVEKARTLLAATDLPVKRIARDTGFADEHYFSKAFRKLTGETPSAFRATARKAESGQ